MKCPACGHKNNEYNHDTLELEYKDTQPFKEIQGHFTMKNDYGSSREVYLFACPECNNVIFEQ